MLDGAMWFGKVCTAVLFAGLLVLFLFSQLEAAVVNGIIMIMMGIMIVTLCMYVPVFQKMKHKEKKDGEE
jgi:cardiolipin synthase